MWHHQYQKSSPEGLASISTPVVFYFRSLIQQQCNITSTSNARLNFQSNAVPSSSGKRQVMKFPVLDRYSSVFHQSSIGGCPLRPIPFSWLFLVPFSLPSLFVHHSLEIILMRNAFTISLFPSFLRFMHHQYARCIFSISNLCNIKHTFTWWEEYHTINSLSLLAWNS